MIKIYNFKHGARGLRAIWLCEEMGLPCSVENLAYPVPESYRAKNSMGQVPFLEDGPVAMNESVAMLFYIAEKYGPTPLLPGRDDPNFARVLQAAVLGETTIGANLNILLMIKFAGPESEKRGWVGERVEARLRDAVSFTSRLLGDSPYVAGKDFTIADISLATALVMWCGPLQNKLSGNLADYQARVTKRAAYLRAVEKAA